MLIRCLRRQVVLGLVLQGALLAQAQIVAFNDHAPSTLTHTNATRFHIFGNGSPTNGALRDIVTGNALPITLTLSRTALGVATGTLGGSPAQGTPLHTVFNGYVDFQGSPDRSAELSGSGTVTYTFSGLNPSNRYGFKGSAVRGDPTYTNRWVLCEITSADAFTAAHSSTQVLTTARVGGLATNQAALCSGVNHTAATGDYVGWDDIQPGADGSFAVVCRQYTGAVPDGSSGGSKGYALTGVRLEEIVGSPTPVSIVLFPTNTVITEGASAMLRVGAAGYPINYQWFKDVQPVLQGTNATLLFSPACTNDSGDYFVIVSNSFSAATSGVVRLTVLPDLTISLIPLTHVWRYNQSGDDLGTSWKETNYVDAAWPAGPGVLALETDSPMITWTNTVLNLTNSAGARVITYYFRTTFVLTNPPDTVYLTFSNLVDDGAVAYLNGQEIYRLNMSNAVVEAATLARGAAAEGVFVVTNLRPRSLVQGTNLLAVEVHQNSTNSSDVVLGLTLSAMPLSAGPALIWQPPQGQSAPLNSTVTFTVGVAGAGPISYQWQRNGVNLADDARISGANGATLTILNLQTNDLGSYRVLVNNGLGVALSQLASLVLPFASLVPRGSWPGYPRGEANGFFLAGQRLYVAQGGGGLGIYDVSDPARPVFLGASDTDGNVRQVHVAGNLAYLADDKSGLRIMDVSNPAQPRLLGGLDSGGRAYSYGIASGVAVSNNTAYIANYSGMNVVDVTNPSWPVAVGQGLIGNGALDIQLSDHYAWVASGAQTLNLYDLTNPTNPVPRPAYNLSALGSIKAAMIAGPYAYLACESASRGIEVVDISNPLSLRLAGYSTNAGYGERIRVQDNTIYVADGNAGARLYILNTPTNPVLVASVATPGWTRDVVRIGSHLYVADGWEGTRIFDLSNPVLPALAGELGHHGSANAVQKRGNLLYVADGYEGFAILDITEPSRPVMVGRFDHGGSCRDVQIVGPLAYVANGLRGLVILDVSAPSNIVEVGQLDTMNARAVVVRSNHVFVADFTGGLRIVDASNPASPTLLGTYVTSSAVEDVVVSGNLAFLASGLTGLEIVNISDLARPVRVGSYQMPFAAAGVAAAGSYVFVAAGADGVFTFDVRDPANPLLVGSYDTSGKASSIEVEGNRLWVATDYSGIRILDISDPTTPLQVGKYETGAHAGALCLDSNRVYVANGEGGLLILDQIAPGTVPPLVRCSEPRIVNGSFALHLSDVIPLKPLILEASTNLVYWQPVFTNTTPPAQLDFSEPATNLPARYYRGRQE